MVTIGWSILIGIAAIWGGWDWRIAATGWIITVVFDIIIIIAANDTIDPDMYG